MAPATATRPKWVSRDARHREIVAATIDSIARVGFADTTLATVARECGMSPGSLVFHFKTKDALLTETLRMLALEFRETWQAAVDAAPDDPVARLLAMVGASFSPKVCNRKILAVWHAFYGEAKSRPNYMKICGELDNQRYLALRDLLEKVLEADAQPAGRAGELAMMIDAFGDGLWLSILTAPDSLDRRQALGLAIAQLRALLPEQADAIDAWRGRT